MRFLLPFITLAVLMSVHAAEVGAGPNVGTTIPLHAIVQSVPPPPPPCAIADPCPDPLLHVPAGATIHAYSLLRNHDEVGGVQTAFDWGNWTFLFGFWNCQPDQITATVPHGNGGPGDGTITTAFDCLTGGDTAIVGYMRMMAFPGACMTQVESAYPFGTHVVTCGTGNITQIEQDGRGSICVGAPGNNGCWPGLNGPGANPEATLPMHAVVLDNPPPEPCNIADPCDPGPPQVNIAPNSNVTTYVMLRNYDNVIVMQTAFDWDGWTFVDGVWSCLPGQQVSDAPFGNGGPLEGSLATMFDCLTGGTTMVVGSMNLIAAGQGCLTQVESALPFGTYVTSCSFEQDAVLSDDRGTICVSSGGHDACGPLSTTVEPTTWGAVKAQFRR